MAHEALVLDATAVAALLTYEDCIDAVEEAFRLQGEGSLPSPAICGVHVAQGGFHVKAAALGAARPYFAAKTNANFPGNPSRHGLPTIQGVLLLFDTTRGVLLAAMDSGEITLRRTAAATAVAARYLAHPNARVMTVCGCGVQGRAHLRALRHVLPLRKVLAFDRDHEAAVRFADEMCREAGIEVRAVTDLAASAKQSDVCVTCTPSTSFLLHAEDVAPGTFVAGVGVDDPAKRELEPALLARSKLVVDLAAQCAAIGDLHQAIRAGAVTDDFVHAELGEIVAGRRPGRTGDREIIVFDSTGIALEDVAAAAVVYERALGQGLGTTFGFAS